MTEWRIPLSDLSYDALEEQAVLRILKSRWLSMGPEVQAFEQEFSDLVGVEHAIAVSSGTAALHLSYLALGLTSGDEVIQPAINFVAAANMTSAVGATPVFADIVALDEPTIDPAEVQRLVGPRTKAIVPMHYGGNVARMTELKAIAESHGLFIVEDACHALGSIYGPAAGADADRLAGSVGTVAAFSFFSNKNAATGEGGMVTTNDAAIAARVRLLRSHGMTSLSWDRFRGHAAAYDVVANGYNYRLDDLRAALGRAQLSKLADLNQRRAALASRYRERLAGADSWTMAFADHIEHSANHLMVAVAADESFRDAGRAALTKAGIQTSMHYPCVADFEMFGTSPAGDVDRSRAFACRAVSLPLYPGLPPEAVDEIVDVLTHATASEAVARSPLDSR